jgi:hypothetical protein
LKLVKKYELEQAKRLAQLRGTGILIIVELIKRRMEQMRDMTQKRLIERSEEAAKKIQRMWRNRYSRKLLSLTVELRRKKAITTVQKFIRGFFVWGKIGRKNRLSAILKYFEQVRRKVKESSQIKLAYHFRKHFKKRQLQREEEVTKQQRKMIEEERRRRKSELMKLKMQKVQSYVESSKKVTLLSSKTNVLSRRRASIKKKAQMQAYKRKSVIPNSSYLQYSKTKDPPSA